MSYHHREESDEAREPSVAPENVELVPELLSHDDRQEKHDQGHKRKEVAHVLDYADPKIKQSRFELLRLFQVSNNKCFALLKPIVNTIEEKFTIDHQVQYFLSEKLIKKIIYKYLLQ